MSDIGIISSEIEMSGNREVNQWGDLFLFPVASEPSATGILRFVLLTKRLVRIPQVVADLNKKKGLWVVRFLDNGGHQYREVKIDSNEEMANVLSSISAMRWVGGEDRF